MANINNERIITDVFDCLTETQEDGGFDGWIFAQVGDGIAIMPTPNGDGVRNVYVLSVRDAYLEVC